LRRSTLEIAEWQYPPIWRCPTLAAVTINYQDATILEGLRELESKLPGLLDQFGQSAEFWRALCERISELEDAAGPNGWMYVNRRVDRMLERLSINPNGWNDFFDA
jgi:hypothetical protein